MRIAVTGSQGQLGRALQEQNPEHELLLIDLPENDITDLLATRVLLQEFKPDTIIHAAAMTDVEGCEKNPDLAYRVNAIGTRSIASSALELGIPVVYISTDYVFDGTLTRPYWEYDLPNPQSIYAQTKWMGEQIIRQHIARHYIVRIAWLYGAGPRNFVRTVLRLARERGEMTMVTDEQGSPTYANDVADALYGLVKTRAYGTHHLPNLGICSRYDWACKILELAGISGVQVHPGTNYQRTARVPKTVELRNSMSAAVGITMRSWQEALGDYLRRG
ncbi:MAG: dTDP-4-dehydrorhamnose reductase [Anaerolineae bacterium]